MSGLLRERVEAVAVIAMPSSRRVRSGGRLSVVPRGASRRAVPRRQGHVRLATDEPVLSPHLKANTPDVHERLTSSRPVPYMHSARSMLMSGPSQTSHASKAMRPKFIAFLSVLLSSASRAGDFGVQRGE
jgi:hypothetical protein